MKKVEPKKVVNPLFEKMTKNFAIGKSFSVFPGDTRDIIIWHKEVEAFPELLSKILKLELVFLVLSEIVL